MKHFVEHRPDFWLPTWDLVIRNLDANPEKAVLVLDNLGVVVHEVCLEEYAPILKVAAQLSEEYDGEPVTAQTMISFSKLSKTYGKHVDDVDVYFLQAIGTTRFTVWEDGQEYVYDLNPSDMIYVPAGLYHSTQALTPRVGISYGVES